MIKKLFVASVTAALMALASHGQSTNRLNFPVSGFSIAPLEAPLGQSPQQALMMFLPEREGFSANVNVQIQPFSAAMDEFVMLSLQQFKTAGFKVLQQNIVGQSTAVFEYTGEMQHRLLHWYARAEKSGDKVYLVTATAPDDQWSRLATVLKGCVDTFSCNSSEATVPKAAPLRQ